MARDLEEITVDNNSFDRKNSDFYPFYVLKSRRSSSRRRSSLQSLQQRRCRFVRRLVRKSGKASIHQKRNRQRSYRFLLDITNTIIDGSWAWTLLLVTLAFICTWLMFAGLWMIIAIDRVEMDDREHTDNGTCLEGISGFAGYLLFSVETQTSIGYGSRYINDYCPEAIFLMCVQITVGVCICGSLVCIVYLKMVGGHRNKHSMDCFSRKAVICQRDGELCLIFRVRDYDMRYECHTKVIAYLVQKRKGELFMKTIKLEPPGILIWPVEVVHRINESSPFWDFSAKDLLIKRFEIIVIMEGSSLATSYMSRTTTSYLSREIFWGYKFKPCTEYSNKEKKFVVNHKLFNKTEEMIMPLCSGQRLQQVFEDLLSASASIYGRNSSDANTSKYSSPLTLSPLFNKVPPIQPSLEEKEEEDEFGETSNKNVTRALVHSSFRSNRRKVIEIKATENDDSSSNSDEDYTTFMDLSVEDLTERNVKSYNNLGGKAKDLLVSLQKFVVEDNRKRLNLDKNYNETSL